MDFGCLRLRQRRWVLFQIDCSTSGWRAQKRQVKPICSPEVLRFLGMKSRMTSLVGGGTRYDSLEMKHSPGKWAIDSQEVKWS